jgi:uncharacterized protein (TIGR03086 family)
VSATALAGAVELLDRSLAWVRPALSAIRPDDLGRRTPCRDWPLAVLLCHMDDGLDAWTEAATGRVSLVPTPAPSPVHAIRDKACALLGWWLDHPPEEVGIGDLVLPAQTLVAAAALEVTLHGWDVHATVGEAVPVPADLARPLLRVAHHVVTAADRDGCLAPPVTPVPAATDSERLLAFLGRG